MITARAQRHVLQFKNPSGTSRGILTEKESWFLLLEKDGKAGIGECGLLRGLSIDDRPDYAQKLNWVCQNINSDEAFLWEALREFPSIQFGLEMALASLRAQDPMVLFPSQFTQGQAAIPINGLVWMGNPNFMRTQIKQKLSDGFSCIKLKIGAIDFNTELSLLASIRKEFGPSDIEIRVDANGAFKAEKALDKLFQLSKFHIHSIEQPIAKGQWETMAKICLDSPIPVALDEELIGVFDKHQQQSLLETIKPQYLIFKPSFIGGKRGTQSWLSLCEQYGIGWWMTSALESNIGLNAIAQYTYSLGNPMPQGLGTGGLYTNNFDCPLEVANGQLHYRPDVPWSIDRLL